MNKTWIFCVCLTLPSSQLAGCADVSMTAEPGFGGAGGAGGIGGAGGKAGAAGTGGAGGEAGAPGTGGAGGEAAAGGTGGVGGTIAERCGGANACVGNPGSGWEGPFALADRATGCEGAFPDEAASLFAGIQAGSPSCGCGCGSATTVCPTSIIRSDRSNFDCSGPDIAGGRGDLDECYGTSKPLGFGSVVRFGGPATSCGEGTVTSSIPVPTWSESISLCYGFTRGTGACDPGQTCVPIPEPGLLDGLCYRQAGDQTCPTGFPNKTIYYVGFSDTRECAESCVCQPSGGRCELTIRKFKNPGCLLTWEHTNPTRLSSGEYCLTDKTDLDSWLAESIEKLDDGSCSPTAVELSGGVTGLGATTVCCQ